MQLFIRNFRNLKILVWLNLPTSPTQVLSRCHHSWICINKSKLFESAKKDRSNDKHKDHTGGDQLFYSHKLKGIYIFCIVAINQNKFDLMSLKIKSYPKESGFKQDIKPVSIFHQMHRSGSVPTQGNLYG